jgi:transcriptional regulator GlxA family with amidase domain
MDRATASRLFDPPQQESVSKLTRHVGVFLFDRCSLPDIVVIGEAFRLANQIEDYADGRQAYRLTLLSSRGGNITSSSSIAILTEALSDYCLGDFDAFVVACSDGHDPAENDAHLLPWLSVAQNRTAPDHPRAERASQPGRVSRAAVPVFWFREASSQSRAVSPTSAEIALAQITLGLGADVANRVARELHLQRDEFADSRVDELHVSTAVDKIHESARWIRENFGNPISVANAAQVAAMSNRNYLRRFKCELGVSPLEYLIRVRLEAICHLLVDTDLPVDKIARRCGMGNGDRLGRLFRKRFGVSPTEYRSEGRARRNFHAQREAGLLEASAQAQFVGPMQQTGTQIALASNDPSTATCPDEA